MFSGSEVWGSVIFDTESHEKRVLFMRVILVLNLFIYFLSRLFSIVIATLIYLMSNAFLSNVSS